MTACYRKEKGLGLSERAGRLRNKGRSCAIVHTESYAFKITAHLENAINIYSELRFGRLLVDGRLWCPTESIVL